MLSFSTLIILLVTLCHSAFSCLRGAGFGTSSNYDYDSYGSYGRVDRNNYGNSGPGDYGTYGENPGTGQGQVDYGGNKDSGAGKGGQGDYDGGTIDKEPGAGEGQEVEKAPAYEYGEGQMEQTSGAGGPEEYPQPAPKPQPKPEHGGQGGPDELKSERGFGGFETTKYVPPPPPITQPPSCLTIIPHLLGQSVTFRPYDPSVYYELNGGPVVVEGELDCDIDNNCCWNNVGAPIDSLEFNIADASNIDINKLEENFGTNTPPDGKFLMVASQCRENPRFEAQFVSCSIVCTDEDVIVTLNHWSSSEYIEIQICARSSFFNDPEDNPLLNCVDIPLIPSPGPAQVKLPPGEVFDVVIVVRNFASIDGGLVMIDNIRVDYTICPPDTTTTTTTTPAPTTLPPTTTPKPEPPGSSEECQNIPCDFEQNHMCTYKDAKANLRLFFRAVRSLKQLRSITTSFKVYKGRFKNYVTGIFKAAQGQRYTAVYLRARDQSSIFTTIPSGLVADRVIRFSHYEATSGLRVKACCDFVTEEGCRFVSDHDVDIEDRDWKSTSFLCKKGTKKIIFVCESVESNQHQKKHQGACGIDMIELYKADENDPRRAIIPACSAGRKMMQKLRQKMRQRWLRQRKH